MSIWQRCLQSLEIGAGRPLAVRHEKLRHLDLGRRILFASDLHLKKSGPPKVVEGLLEIVSRERPDVVLLGGDLVDWRTGLPTLNELVREISRRASVAAVGGNHDRWIGLARVRKAVLQAGGHWLDDEPFQWAQQCVVYGRPDQARLRAECHVLCSHDPSPPSAQLGFDLILSGHLHGGQFVFYEYKGRLYPGAFLYRWNGLRFHDGARTLLVSRGVRDTLPLRWNCPREVILVEI